MILEYYGIFPFFRTLSKNWGKEWKRMKGRKQERREKRRKGKGKGRVGEAKGKRDR